jgi:hypothetical protein
MRDPDSSCDITVYVDGVSVADVHEYSFDPGAGYSMDDFEENRQWHIANAPDYLKPVLEQIYEDMQPTYERWSL